MGYFNSRLRDGQRLRARGGGASTPWYEQGKADGVVPLLQADFINNRYASRTSPLRVASARNQIYFTRVNQSGMDGCVIEFTEMLGNDTSNLILSFSSKYLLAGTGDQNVGNNWTIQEVAIVNASRTISVPVYFAGSRSRTMIDGEVDIQTDPIYPSQFGLNKFSVDDKFYIKARITGASGFYVPGGDNTWGNYGPSGDNVILYWYNSAVTTPSNTDLTTRYTASGTAFTWGYNGPKPFILGNVIGKDRSIVGIGDSISSSVNDGATNEKWGVGLFQRATRSTSGTDTIAALNLSISSLRLDTFNASTYANTFLKYANSAYIYICTNDVNNGASLSTLQSRMATLYSNLASNNISNIVQHYLMCYTTSTDSWATEVNQTAYNSNWNAGGIVEQFNAWLETQLSVGNIDYLLNGNSARGTTANYKWLSGASGDGLHPNATGHEILAIPLRPILRSMSNSVATIIRGFSDVFTFSRTSSATYFDSTGTMQTASSGQARFDYNPITLQPLGILIEDTRTNLVLNSATGTNQSITVTAVAHTLSFYGTGTVTLSGAYAGSLVGTGEYPVRSTLTFTPSAGSLTIACTGTIQFIQIEAGAQATSYIPTTVTSATRQADQCVNNSSSVVQFDGWSSKGVGTVYSSFSQPFSPTGNARIAEMWASGNDSNSITRSSSAVQSIRRVSGSSEFMPFYSLAFVKDAIVKSAATFCPNDYTILANGGTPVTDATSPIPATPIRLHIGYANGPTSSINGHIREFRWYPMPVSDAELQRITA